MKSAVEVLEPTRVKITVESPYEELKPQIDAAYRQIATQVSVPGFRRGKVPARIIDQRVGRAAVIEQAINDAMPGLYRDAVIETGVKALGQPEISVTEIPAVEGAPGGKLEFTAEVDVRPEIQLPPLSTILLEVDAADVTDEAVDTRLNLLRERFGTLIPVERPVEFGDFVVIDLTANIDGKEVESVSGISYEVGSQDMIEGLDDALVGAVVDEPVTFTSVLAGGDFEDQEAEVSVTVTEVKERELPEADDEFAQLASEFDTIGELRDDLRSEVAKSLIYRQVSQAKGLLLSHLRQNTDFPLPQGVVDAEVAAHLEREGKSMDDPHAVEAREDTETMLRNQLILDVVTEQFEVEVTQDELLQYLFAAAQNYGMDPAQFIQIVDREGQIPAYMGEAGRDKALAVALRQVRVSDSRGADVNLAPHVGTNTEEEAAIAAQVEKVAKAAWKAPAAEKAPAEKAPAAKKEPAAEKKAPAAKKEPAAEKKAPAAKKAPAKKEPAKKAPAAKKPTTAE